jgi:hypothetical protein
VHRSADYRHQVLEISPPVSMEGNAETAFKRCASAMEGIIRAHPAEWDFWFEPGDLASLGLLPAPPAPAAQAEGQAGQAGELQQSSR